MSVEILERLEERDLYRLSPRARNEVEGILASRNSRVSYEAAETRNTRVPDVYEKAFQSDTENTLDPGYRLVDVGPALVAEPRKLVYLPEDVVETAANANARSIKLYDPHNSGLAPGLEKQMRKDAVSLTRYLYEGGKFTRGRVPIAKRERPLVLDAIPPEDIRPYLMLDRKRMKWVIKGMRVDKPGGFYIPHVGTQYDGLSVIDVTQWLPRRYEDEHVTMVERDLRRAVNNVNSYGGIFGLEVELPQDISDMVRSGLRRNYFSERRGPATHEVNGHWSQDMLGMLSPQIASRLGTRPYRNVHLIEGHNVKQTEEGALGYSSGYRNLMPTFNDFLSRKSVKPNDLTSPEWREWTEREWKSYLEEKVRRERN